MNMQQIIMKMLYNILIHKNVKVVKTDFTEP